VAAVTSLRH